MFKRLFSRRSVSSRKTGPSFDLAAHLPTRFEGERPMPAEALAVVGDIHGDLLCFNNLIDKLKDEAPHARWIFVGDYIDRGEQSAAVLMRLREIETERPNTICLLGNHEEMLLSFLKSPVESGNRWMRYGGLQTMASFGGQNVREQNDPETLLAARDHLVSIAPEGLLDWIAERPRSWRSGNVVVVHAAADPRKSLEDQKPDVLTWGHRLFGQVARTDGLWIVHGHTIVDTPLEQNGVISVDTGAYATGRLTACVIENGNDQFVQGHRR